MRARALLIAACFSILPAGAHAQESDTRARELFQSANQAYEEGRFEEAESLFRESYQLSGRHELLYNIGLAADRARHDRAALEAYREFVSRVPASTHRSRAERRIAELEQLVGPTEEPTPTLPSSGGVDPAPWTIVGISAAVLVLGVILVGIAVADVSAIENAPVDSDWDAYAEAYARTEPLSIAGFVLAGVGLAGVVAGIAWGALGSSSTSSARLRIFPGGLSLTGTF